MLDRLESNPGSLDLEEDGAVEPISRAKDSHMQHSKMLKFKAPVIVPRLDLKSSAKKKTKKLRSGSIMVGMGIRKSSHASIASDSNLNRTSGRSPPSKPEGSQRVSQSTHNRSNVRDSVEDHTVSALAGSRAE